MNRRRYLIIVGIVVAAVVIAVLANARLANHRPVIAGLEAPERVVPKGRSQIVCNASDPDGDVISYNWSATGGNISGTGAAVNWTAPESLGSYNVTVTVSDSRGEEVAKRTTIEVRANDPPTVAGLTADAEWTNPSGSIHVTCTASDPDDDELTYEWAVTAGDISGTGTAVNWTAPEAVGVYNVTVVVKDGHGSQDARFVTLCVDLATPPTIENLIVSPIENIYLRPCTVAGCDYDVWKTKEYEIACNVTDTSGKVVYAWSCTDGQIAGGGSAINWTAPSKTLMKATVTLVVSDAAGNSRGKNLVFHVPSCTCGSW